MAIPIQSQSGSRSPRARNRLGSGDQQARMTRYYEQLHEATNVLGTDRHSLGRRPSLGCPSPRAEASVLEPKTMLRRSKFAFVDADMWGTMIKGYVESGDGWKHVDTENANRWQDAKNQNKELKAARIREEQVHAELHKSVAEAYQEARDASEMCDRQLKLLQTQQDSSEGTELNPHAGEGEDLDLCPSWSNGPHGEAAEEAARQTEELSRVMSLHERELDKKGRLTEELQALQMELDRAKCRTKDCESKQKQAFDCADSLEQILRAQVELGFPEITFRDACQLDESARSTVVLSGAAGASTDEAIRSVTVEFAKDGHLVSAVPHPALGLEREAAEAAKLDDLPSLLTKIWHRVCDGKQRKTSRGGA